VKQRQFQRLIKQHLLKDLPGFDVQGSLLYEKDFDYLLKGICFDSSGYNKTYFTGWVFVQPLYLPSDHLFFNFGDRFGSLSGGGDGWWDMEGRDEKSVMWEVYDRISTEGLPFLRKFSGPKDFTGKRFDELGFMSEEPFQVQIKASSLFLIGEFKKGVKEVEALEALMEKIDKEDNSRDHMKPHVMALRKAVDAGPDAVKKQLDEWTEYTIENLKLKKCTT